MLAVRTVRRHQRLLAQCGSWVLTRARRVPIVGRALERVGGLVPSGYVALHLALGFLAIAAVIGFAIVAEEVTAGQTVAEFDHAFAEALHAEASPQWRTVFRRLTWFGSGEVLTVGSVLIAAILLIRARYVLAAGWIFAQAGSGLLVITLKSAFARTRPPLPDAQLLTSWSFPSGHALATFVFCGMGAYLLLRSTRSWTVTTLVVAGALAWCLVIGFTRLYLGVHFASDVIAGLIAATAWVAVCVSGVELGLRSSTSASR